MLVIAQINYKVYHIYLFYDNDDYKITLEMCYQTLIYFYSGLLLLEGVFLREYHSSSNYFWSHSQLLILPLSSPIKNFFLYTHPLNHQDSQISTFFSMTHLFLSILSAMISALTQRLPQPFNWSVSFIKPLPCTAVRMIFLNMCLYYYPL